jgi:hypothetical protein
MDRLLYILDKIVYGVDWVFLFYLVCGVTILIIAVRRLGLSPLHAVMSLITEMMAIFVRTTPRAWRSMIDGILTISAIVFTAVMGAPVAMLELYGNIPFLRTGIERENQWQYLFMLMFITTCLSGLISLYITRGEE